MPIQHRHIEDGERHEIKGARTALSGTVPVATGSGTTSFQRIGVSQLKGSMPNTIPGRVITTDGSDGFSAQTEQAAHMATYQIGNLPPVIATTMIYAIGEFRIDGLGFVVPRTGFYWFNAGPVTLSPPSEGQPNYELRYPRLYAEYAPDPSYQDYITDSTGGMVHLTKDTRYRFTEGKFSLWKMEYT